MDIRLLMASAALTHRRAVKIIWFPSIVYVTSITTVRRILLACRCNAEESIGNSSCCTVSSLRDICIWRNPAGPRWQPHVMWSISVVWCWFRLCWLWFSRCPTCRKVTNTRTFHEAQNCIYQPSTCPRGPPSNNHEVTKLTSEIKHALLGRLHICTEMKLVDAK